ncbi:hypothetical protein T12_13897 [Trichinella patagoniensis]|uniref:Uncharacterized protein n=1 Tax=Trichinella patagoniensis TaxID=990121 RepID=A0A0V0ZS05_9BILA|nr:hypothetical protein T12_13897 [Trichinella patagoniensis]
MSPRYPRTCYEALPLPLAVLKLSGTVRIPSRLKHHEESVLADTLSLDPPEKSTGVPVLFADLDLYIHLLHVRLQPYPLTGGEPPTGRSRYWDMLSTGGSTKLLCSELSRRIQHSTFVLHLLPCRPHRVEDTRSARVVGTLVPLQPTCVVL